jgi:hypothetical protein
MKIKNTGDEERIWQALVESRVTEEGTDGKTDDLTEREKFLLAKKAGDEGKGPLADDDEEDKDVKEEGTKGTEKDREEADTNNDGDIDEDEKTEANKDRDEEGKEHLCAKKVKHESYGEGTCIPERHGVPIDGHVNWYTVIFEHDTEVVDTKDLTIIASEMHNH